MVRPSLRSRSLRRVSRRVPGSTSKLFYEKRSVYVAHCSLCGRALGGVPRDLKVIRHGSRSAKRPERPYGGILCPSCLALAYKLAVRGG